MPVYDFSSGFNALNQGIGSIGDALKEANQRAQASQFANLVGSDQIDQAIMKAGQMGDTGLVMKLQAYKQGQASQGIVSRAFGGMYGAGAGAGTTPIDQSGSDTSSASGGQTSTAPTGGSGSLTTTRSGAEISPTLKGQVWQTPTGPVDAQAASWAVHGVESKANDYQSVGPVVQKGSYAGDRAFGLHQVMGNNIGPWTQEVLGTPMTRQQFLASPEAQDRVFAAKFGQYAQQYGLAGAANMWFTGSPNPDPNRSDQYMRAGDYGNNVTTNYAGLTKQMPAAAGGQMAPSRVARGSLPPMPQMVSPSGQPVTPTGQPIQVASAGAMPTPDAGPVAPPSGVGDMTGAPYGSGPAVAARPVTVPGAAPATTPAPAVGAPATVAGASVAIPFAKYGGKSYTREQAVAQDAAEARDMASAPEAPNTEEWDAQAKATGVAPAAATPTGVSPGAAPTPATTPSAASISAAKPEPLPPNVRQQYAQAQGMAGSQKNIGMLIQLSTLPGLSEGMQKTIGTLLQSELEATKLPDVVKQYLFAKTPAGGSFVGSLQDWQDKSKDPDNFIQLITPEERAAHGIDPSDKRVWNYNIRTHKAEPTATGGSLVTVENIPAKVQSAGAVEREKLAAEREGALATQASMAPQNISRLKLLGAVLDKTETGPLAGVFSTIGGVAQSIGLNPKDLPFIGIKADQATNADIAGKLAKELVLGSIGAKNGGFPASNFSNASREFIDKMFPNILNMPGANKAVQDVLIAREQAYQKMFDAWGIYQDQQEKAGNADPNYSKFERNYQREHADDNIFQPVIDKFNAGLYGPTGTAPPTANPQLKPQGMSAPASQAPPTAAPIQIPAGMTPDQIRKTYGGKGGVRIILPPTPSHPNGGEGFVP